MSYTPSTVLTLAQLRSRTLLLPQQSIRYAPLREIKTSGDSPQLLSSAATHLIGRKQGKCFSALIFGNLGAAEKST